MNEKDEKLLAELEIRMRQLMYLCDSLKEENNLLRQELILKSTETENLFLQLEKLKTKYDNLRFVKSFSSGDNEGIQAAKLKLSQLVQDVDKCIALLRN